jgi:L-alanine-DL-glutamate epimerase-like enolase superfamily enzyme
LEITKRGNIRRLVLDPQEFGSILAVKKSAAVAEAAGIRMSFCCKDSAGLLLASMLQLSASLPAMSLGIECYPHHFEKSLLFAPVEINDGLAHFSYAPGLSAGIDRNKLEQYQIF